MDKYIKNIKNNPVISARNAHIVMYFQRSHHLSRKQFMLCEARSWREMSDYQKLAMENELKYEDHRRINEQIYDSSYKHIRQRICSRAIQSYERLYQMRKDNRRLLKKWNEERVHEYERKLHELQLLKDRNEELKMELLAEVILVEKAPGYHIPDQTSEIKEEIEELLEEEYPVSVTTQLSTFSVS